jgi:lipid II:glycine glycyltransferase (peptidoglycan interpeptide bridge formation enzyme)
LATLTAESLDEQAWRDRLEALPSYSYFATPDWARSVAGASLGYTSQAYEFALKDDRALLPVAIETNRIGRTILQSGPYGTYGGLLPLDDRATYGPELGTAVAVHLSGRPGFGALMAYPGPHKHHPFPRVLGRYEAFVLQLDNLADRPEGDGAGSMRKKTRQYIRKAEREGVDVASDQSPSAFADYYRLVELSARRWGLPEANKPWSLFESICRNAGDGCVRLWMARVAGEPAAGLLCFYGKGEAFAWSAALDERHAETRANYLLHWRAIADAAERGFTTFNLGANENLPGVRWFKEGLGASPREYPAYIVATVSYSVLIWAAGRSRAAMRTLRSLRRRA